MQKRLNDKEAEMIKAVNDLNLAATKREQEH